jgi:hypothetical protein
MSLGNYKNLFLDADIDGTDYEKYSRCLDVVLAEDGLSAEDVIGVGENGTGSNRDLYVVHRQAVVRAREKGIFNKRVEIARLCPTAAIARLREGKEGFKGTDLTVTAYDASGEQILKIAWGLGGPDWVEPLLLRQRENLLSALSRAMDATPSQP